MEVEMDSSFEDSSMELSRDNLRRQLENEQFTEEFINEFMRADSSSPLHPKPDNSADHFSIQGPFPSIISKRFNTSGQAYFVNFSELNGIEDLDSVVTSAFSAVLHSAKQNSTSNDLFGAEVQHPALDTPVLITFRKKDSLTPELITSRIEAIQQSKKDFQFDDEMLIKIVKISMPQGMGNEKLRSGLLNEYYFKRQGHGSCFIRIQNNDFKCFPRAVAVAMARAKAEEGEITQNEYKSIANCRFKAQEKKADELLASAGIEVENIRTKGCGMEEIKLIQSALNPMGYSLKIFSYNAFDAMIFDGGLGGGKCLFLYHSNNHYDVLKSARPITGTNFFCSLCNCGYDKINEHRCPARCPGCRYEGRCQPDYTVPTIKCADCSRFFYSQTCFDNHRRPYNEVRHDTQAPQPAAKKRKLASVSLCNEVKKCGACMRSVPARLLNPPEKHHCMEKQCQRCLVWDKCGEDHICYVQPYKMKKQRGKRIKQNSEHRETESLDLDGAGINEDDGASTVDGEFKYLFWDFECQQKKVLGEDKVGEIFEHEPLLAVCKKICSGCQDFSLAKCPSGKCKHRDCQDCQGMLPKECKCKGVFYKEFLGTGCKEKFCEYLFQKDHKGYTCIAHNGKGYDAQFIMRWLIENRRKPSNIIARGLQILSMEVLGMRIIDSLAFVAQPLESFPKTFGIDEMKKGFFPYLFLTDENLKYVGSYPPADSYCPSSMSKEKRDKFYAWYNSKSVEVFNMTEELRAYCESDVDILQRSMMKFDQLYFSITGIRPLSNSISIAQSCNQVWRKNFMRAKTVAIIPPDGICSGDRMSKVAQEYLAYYSHKHNVRVDHGRNGKERKIGQFKVDGFIPESKTVLEFNG